MKEAEMYQENHKIRVNPRNSWRGFFSATVLI